MHGVRKKLFLVLIALYPREEPEFPNSQSPCTSSVTLQGGNLVLIVQCQIHSLLSTVNIRR